MKSINYFMIVLLCLVPHVLCAAEKNKVTFKEAAEEPLMNMARSVSSDAPPVEGALRMQRMPAAPPPIPEEGPDAVEVEDTRRPSIKVFTFDAAAGEAVPAAARPPRPSPRANFGATLRSPRGGTLSALTSPRSGNGGSRRSSMGSIEDDPATKALVAKMCDISGKNTRSAQQHFRRLYKQQQQKSADHLLPASGSLQSIEGEPLDSELHVDAATLAVGSRGGSIASGGDVARDEWLPQPQGELTPDTRAYLRRLKTAAKKTGEVLRSALRPTVATDAQLDIVVQEGTRKALASMYHAHHRTRSGVIRTALSPAEDQRFAQEIERANTLGCCSCCVIM